MPMMLGVSPWGRCAFPHPSFWDLFSFSFTPCAGSHTYPLLIFLLLPGPSVFSLLFSPRCRVAVTLLLAAATGVLWADEKQFVACKGKGFLGFPKIFPICSLLIGMLLPTLSFASSRGEVQPPPTSQASWGNNTARPQPHAQI